MDTAVFSRRLNLSGNFQMFANIFGKISSPSYSASPIKKFIDSYDKGSHINKYVFIHIPVMLSSLFNYKRKLFSNISCGAQRNFSSYWILNKL